jgi:hypothetical protein
MAQIRKVLHLRTSGSTAPTSLTPGEIALRYKAGEEALFIQNTDGQVVSFDSSANIIGIVELNDIKGVSGDSEVSLSLSEPSLTGRTITVKHASGSTQSGFKKLKSDAYGHITGGSAVDSTDIANAGGLTSITGENGISANTKSNGTQKVGHTNIVAAGTASGTGTSNLSYGGKFKIPTVSYDGNGHVTSTSTTELTLPTDYINSVEGTSGISASVSSKKLTVKHTNSITADSAKTSSTTVTATPSGNNIVIPVVAYDGNGHVTSTGTTNVSLKVNTASTSTAGVVKIATTTGTNNTDIVMTQKAVTDAITDSFAAQDAMVYKGLVGSGTNYGFPTTFSKGATYKVATAFTADSVAYEIGDMFIANTDVTTSENYTKAHWDAIQTNLDPTLYVNTARTISAGTGLTGGGNLSANRTLSLATTGTAGTYGPTADVTGNEGNTIKVPQITTDSYGRVTSVTERTYTSKNTTYTAASAAPPKVSSASTVGDSDNYARQDHTHGIDVAPGDAKGQIKVAGQNVSVSGISTMAYESTSSYSSATQVNSALATKASTACTISAGTGLTGGGNLSANRTLSLATTGTAGTYKQVVVDAYGRVTSGNTADADTWRAINVNGTQFIASTSSTALNLANGSSISITTGSTGTVTFTLGDIDCGTYA